MCGLKKLLKNKKSLIFIVVFLVVIAMVLFFLVWRNYRENKEFGEKIVGELLGIGILPENFIENKTPEGVFLENEDIGIKIKIPENWEVKGYYSDNLLVLRSPDYEYNPDSLQRISGCSILIEISYYRLFASDNLFYRIEQIKEGKTVSENQRDESEIILISGNDALKTIRGRGQETEGVIEVGIPFLKSKAEIKLETAVFKDGPECIQEFDEFLKTIYINSSF
jgi:hypothetical protein